MSSINFDNVYLLFIAIPLVALFVVPFVLAIRKENRNGHNIASMVLHIVMAGLVAFAAAGTHVTTVATETDVYVVADVSFSANKNLDTIDSYIKKLGKNLPRNSKMGVVCFGKDAEVLTPLGGSLAKVSTSGVDDTETNITEALEYTADLFRDSVIKRIVLITDGRQTYTNDAGELKRAAANLNALGIRLDAIYLDDNISADAREVQISSAEFTRSAYLGRSETVTVYVDSSFVSPATVTLYKDGEYLRTSARELSIGTNTVTLELDTSEAGSFEYLLEVSAEGDESDLNNRYTFTQKVSDAVNMLVVSESWADVTTAVDLYGENIHIEVYDMDTSVSANAKKQYMSAHPDVVFHTNATALPVNIEQLCAFDEIVLSSIDLSKYDNYEIFVHSVNLFVSSLGKSLLTFGDLGIQDKTQGELKELDEILPIRYGDAQSNPKLYTIVIDTSHSMQIWSRMILARQAAKQLVKTLSDEDYVCIVAFWGNVRVVQTPTSLKNRDKINQVLDDDLIFGQGTLVSKGIERAMNELIHLNFSEKQMMLITDGRAYNGVIDGGETGDSGTDRELCNRYVETMHAYGIVTSVLAVGGGDQDRTWLKDLAVNLGGGNYYFAETEEQLVNAVFGEISKESGKVVNENAWIGVQKPHDKSLKDVDMTGAFVSKFVLGKTKSSATNVLTAGYNSGNVTIDVPLYAYWNYGNGRIASYAGELSAMRKRADQYSADAIKQTNELFFRNLADEGEPAEKTDYPYRLSIETEGKAAKITVTPADLHASATAKVTVTTPGGSTLSDSLVINFNEYYYDFKIPEVGKYQLGITYEFGGRAFTAEAEFTLSYEPEYDAFAVFDASVLYKMLAADGTVSEDGNLTVVNDEKDVKEFTVHLTVPLLITAVVLLVADIVIRKLKWNDIVSLFRKIKPKDGGKK